MTSKPISTKVQFDRPRSKYVRVKFGDIIKVLAMIESNGHSRKLANKTRRAEHKIRIPSATVIAVKELVAAHPEMGRSALGKRVLYAKGGPPDQKRGDRENAGLPEPHRFERRNGRQQLLRF